MPRPRRRVQAVYINNRSSQTINNIYLSPVGNDQWGDDRLGDKTLLANGRLPIDPGMANGCTYDVRVIYVDKQTEEQRNQNEAQGLGVTEQPSASARVVGDVVDSARASTFQVECKP